MTAEIRALLRAIRGRHAAKKRTTVIKLAFAKANQQPLAQVFKQKDVCAEVIWYQKWQYSKCIKAAFEACYERALEWADDETATLEDHYRRQRRQSVARYAADAPAAMAAVMADQEQRGDHRTQAADTLMRWAEPETASKISPAQAGGGDQVINQLISGLSNDEIVHLLSGDEEGDAQTDEAAAGDTAEGDSGTAGAGVEG